MVKRRKSKVMRSERFTTSVSRVVEYGSVGVLGLLLLTMLFPTVNRSTYATCADGTSTEECTVTQAETEPEVTVKTSLAVSMDNKAAMEVVPTSKGATTIGTTNLTVATNSVDGYSLYMQSSDGLTNTSTLHEGNDLLAEKISITEQDSTLSNMKNNRYGYYLGDTAASSNTVFSALPTTNTIIKQTTSTTGSVADTDYNYGDSYVLSFGVKVGTELPAGIYSGSVTMSAVANPETVQSMAGLTYMQDMTSDICTNTREGYTKQLIDTRDGKSYWVAKLKDGNCWMTQNLAFTITQEMIESNSINSTNTDLHPNDPSLTGAGQLYTDEVTGITYWNNNEAVTYRPKATNSVAFEGKPFSGNNTNTWSWNLGEIVLATPTFTKLCSDRVEGDGYASAFSSDNLAEVCGNSGFLDVSKDGWQPGYTVQIGSYTMPNGKVYPTDFTLRENDLGYVAADQNSRTYDAHYLIGNYYQQNAATAGTGGELEDGAYAPSSICPTGWQLPVAGTGVFGEAGNLSSGITRSLTFLLKQYSMAFSDEYSWAVSGNGQYRFLAYPFYNVVSGSIMAYSGTLRLAGSTGYIWSGAKNYETRFDGGSVFASDLAGTSAAAIGASNGMNVRCVAR